jgi:hypothetical protein
MRHPRGSISDQRSRRSTLAAVSAALAALAALLGLACSTTTSAAEKWTASYVAPPDRVWAAINQTLEALGYDIVQADRHESIIVAAAGADDPTTVVTLRIAQVAHTDVIRVYVSPHEGTSDSVPFETAAGGFLASLDATMRGGARPRESSDS